MMRMQSIFEKYPTSEDLFGKLLEKCGLLSESYVSMNMLEELSNNDLVNLDGLKRKRIGYRKKINEFILLDNLFVQEAFTI